MIRGPGLKPKQTSQVSVRSNLLQLINAYVVSSLVLPVRLICFRYIRELKQRPRRRQRERQKTNNNFIKYHAFLYISLPSLHDYDVKLPHFTFFGGREHKTSTFFPELRYKLSLEFNSRKICQHLTNWTGWNKRDKFCLSSLVIRELKQLRRRPQRRLQKNNRFNDQNNSSVRFLVHFFDVHRTTTTFYGGRGHTTTNFPSSFELE